MKYRIEISDEYSEDLVIFARGESAELERIKAILSESEKVMYGYSKDGVVKLDGEGVYCFFVENGKTYALTKEGKYQVKARLYQLEAAYGEFVKINQSCLVNISEIERFGTSFGGALSVTLKNGYKDYVSRRQIRVVKERMGF